MAIAESHREKSRSQQDLKRQFEEFSRNLSFGRSRHHRKGSGGGAHSRQHRCLDAPNKKVSSPSTTTTTAGEDEEEGEAADEVGLLVSPAVTRMAPQTTLGIAVLMPDAEVEDIDFPQGFAGGRGSRNAP